MNEKALKFFSELAQKENISQDAVRLSKFNHFTEYDVDFIKNIVNANSEILDVGAGTGLIVNQIVDNVKFIEALEPIKAYSDFIICSEKIHIVNATIQEYTIAKHFDFVLCYGLAHYLNTEEARLFYKKFYDAVKSNGKMIVKNQFGVQEDVIIDKFSEELQTMYYSEYRTVEHEKALLAEAGFKNFEVVDIYPPECSRWENTHYYAITAEKK